MNPNNIRSLLFPCFCALVLLDWSQPSSAGVVIISGDDADEDGHCYSDVAGIPDDGSLYPNALDLAISSSTSPGIGIVAIGGANCGTAGKALRAWNDVANGGPGASITVLDSVTEISTVTLSGKADVQIVDFEKSMRNDRYARNSVEKLQITQAPIFCWLPFTWKTEPRICT